MAELNRADVRTLATTVRTETTKDANTAERVGALLENIIDSFINKLSDKSFLGLKTYNTARTYEAGEGAYINGVLHQANKNTQGALNMADWDPMQLGTDYVQGLGIFIDEVTKVIAVNLSNYITTGGIVLQDEINGNGIYIISKDSGGLEIRDDGGGTLIESHADAGANVNLRVSTADRATTLANIQITSAGILITGPLKGVDDLSNSPAANDYVQRAYIDKIPVVADATVTTKGKVELAVDGENAAGVVVQGNDSRLQNNEKTTNKNIANGYAGLNASGKISVSALPDPVTPTLANISGAVTIDLALGDFQKFTQNGNITSLTLTNGIIGKPYYVQITQSAAGWTVAGVDYTKISTQEGIVLGLSNESGAKDILTVLRTDTDIYEVFPTYDRKKPV